jgi:hypothetical protein
MRNKRVNVVMLVLISMILMISCTGPAGPEGPVGPQGPAGPQTPGIYYIRIFQNGVYSSTYTGQVESCIYKGYSSPVYTSNTQPIAIGAKSQEGDLYRALLKFDLSSLPSSKIIVDKAELTIKTSSVNYGGGAYNVKVYKLTSSWNVFENGWTYKTSSSFWTTPGGDYDPNTITPQSATIDLPANSTITIELDPKVVQGWMENPATKYGLLIRGVEEMSTTNNYAEIYPGGASNPEDRPKLKVCYYTIE